MREERAQLVQAHQHHQRHRVPPRRERDDVRPRRRDHAAVGQHRVRACQHLRARARLEGMRAFELQVWEQLRRGERRPRLGLWRPLRKRHARAAHERRARAPGPLALFTRAIIANTAESAMSVVWTPASASLRAILWPS